ncbi:lytic transglycosylase domain-containing protein [Microbacterium sp. STN6]|uniref:aggregation-promoting factor C-terminal-like domain-containing protein n=1 Tax=Microbacterium sp. STN6 TaxID=2995588 RepID=UPI002260830E|nr:lytic transglycosylase domain-containing protein [Microbacterium sp. STN6]MCX7522137.1 lytic transglycosylase domain-containing protein [Microbacterium sp. STN6]
MRSRISLVLFSFFAASAFLLVNVVDPYAGATASPTFDASTRFGGAETQSFVAGDDLQEPVVSREGYTMKEAPKPPPPPPAPAAPAKATRAAPAVGAPDPGSAQAYAHDLLASRGMGEDQYACLVALWNRESHWNVYAYNASSGAYGIPQALPGSKMASVGADWQTSYQTQITWGLSYIGRWGDPCGAWAHSERTGWY